MSGNDKDDNEVKPGDVQRSPGVYLTAEENPRNPQLGYRRWLCDQSSSKWVPLLPNHVDRIAQNVREGKERNEEKDGEGYI